jgi:FAD/FMN-containing dehydrogenase
MKRRTVLASIAAAGVMAGCSTLRPIARARPGESAWPSEAAWQELGREVAGRLERVVVPSPDPATAKTLFSNPVWIGDQVGLTQASGWVNGWTSTPSAYAVRAETAADVAAAIKFAARHRVRLVVKGGGHSYMGGSSAPDSLLVWTRAMQAIEVHEAFVPQGSTAKPIPAVSVGAGCIWGRVYDAVTTKHGRYVQGGGCTTVGVAGLVQGGGFGSFSKGFGLAAASLLEAEIVTADGDIRIVNDAREPELLWALKGGGGGTFGVVTRLTLKTHTLPTFVGAANLGVTAKTDAAFRTLVARFIDHYATNLHNPHWGEQARLMSGRRLSVDMVHQGLTGAEANAAWKDFRDFLTANAADYTVTQPLSIQALPANKFWDRDFLARFAPDAITLDPRPDANPRDFWWKGDGGQAGAVLQGYQSAWLPDSLLAKDSQAKLVDAWVEASKFWTVSFHFNKGLSGTTPEAREASRATCMNPEVLDAFALAIIASEGASTYPQLPEADLSDVPRRVERIGQAMAALRAAAPAAGCYLSECDFFLKDWQRACWGDNYTRLKRIKTIHDPAGLFIVHHGVGSEGWTEGGFAPA